jgi:hypothetical protein
VGFNSNIFVLMKIGGLFDFLQTKFLNYLF